ncbi:Verrucotoxin subunit beta [Triplophysa tibetana]|uniref:Verrucotoxin subunit beta n=1 Tax=Triplophysa tibetana TaxID=1572043 RepID=A0A5A9NQX5_9TELE|nr:Verrucotoxin subunit beta [Triplophysa tibetana]
MDPVGVNAIETAALGRPFQLGMLYDCRKDALVPGLRLWTKEQLEQNICANPQIYTDFQIITSDSLEEKLKILKIDGSLKLSLLGGLVSLSGAANYLNDTKKSFNQQRLTLHYHCTTQFKEMTINQLTSGDVLHYDDDGATHVVTAVVYGADACFVFDREVSSDEDKTTVETDVQVALKELKCIASGKTGAKFDLNANQKTALQKFSCTFYGDFQLSSNPTTFEEAVKVFESLPNLLGENNERVVPLRVWLYPLDKLFSRVVKFQHDISISLITDIESMIESLNTTEMKCSDLLTDKPALEFKAFQDKIQQMKQNCHIYKLSLMKELGLLLPKIRGKFIKDTELIDLLREHEESPFHRSALEQWLTEKEEESDVIKILLSKLNDSGATVEVKLNNIMMDLEAGSLVSYTFTSLGWSDELLSEQKAYRRPETKGKNDVNTADSKNNSWLTQDIQKIMKNNLKIFKDLIDSNDCKSTKFIVLSKEMEEHPGSCILLIEDGSDDVVCFSPPSKPDCPIIEEIRGPQVVLRVSLSCPATVEKKLLYKMKKEKDWTSQHVLKNQRTVTLTDLRSDTEYDIKCAAVGNLNYTIESDVVRHDISISLITDIESMIESLNTTEMKCSDLLTDKPALEFKAFQDKIQRMKQNCHIYKLSLMKELGLLLPKIRGKFIKDTELIDLLREHEESPFHRSALEQWLTEKEEESDVIKILLSKLNDSGATVEVKLNNIMMDLEAGSLVSYTFTSLGWSDELLSEQKAYRRPETKGKNDVNTADSKNNSWLTQDIQKIMKNNLKIFKDLIDSNDCKSTKFIVLSKEMEEHPGSCILLSEDGSDDVVCFSPPSKPDCPIIEEIRGPQVVLRVSPSCPATVEKKLLYKMKREKDWTSQHVLKNQRTVTLTDLRSDTEYDIKCAAVGNLNYTIESDVVRHDISISLITDIESMIESLNTTDMKCSDLLTDKPALEFKAFQDKIQRMKQNCHNHKLSLMKELGLLLPKIRGKFIKDTELIDLLREHEESPFHRSALEQWLKEKEEESDVIKILLSKLNDSGATVEVKPNNIMMDLEAGHLVSYTFTSLGWSDELLSEQKAYRRPETKKKNDENVTDTTNKPWLTQDIQKIMKNNLMIFKDLIDSNDCKSTKFIVMSKEMEEHPGSCILLIEDGCDDAVCFSPPSKPDCPIVEEIIGPQVVLRVSPSCPATVEKKLLYKMKKEKAWTSQPVLKNQRTATLTDLNSDTEYDIKCAAVGNLNYTIESDVVRVTTKV